MTGDSEKREECGRVARSTEESCDDAPVVSGDGGNYVFRVSTDSRSYGSPHCRDAGAKGCRFVVAGYVFAHRPTDKRKEPNR